MAVGNNQLLDMLLRLQQDPNMGRIPTEAAPMGPPRPMQSELDQIAALQEAVRSAQLPDRPAPVEAAPMGALERLAAALGSGMTAYAAGMGAGQARDFAGEARQRYQSEADRMTAANDRSYQDELQRVLFDVGQKKEELGQLRGDVQRDEARRLAESDASAARAERTAAREDDQKFRKELQEDAQAFQERMAGVASENRGNPAYEAASDAAIQSALSILTSPEGLQAQLAAAGNPKAKAEVVKGALDQLDAMVLDSRLTADALRTIGDVRQRIIDIATAAAPPKPQTAGKPGVYIGSTGLPTFDPEMVFVANAARYLGPYIDQLFAAPDIRDK